MDDITQYQTVSAESSSALDTLINELLKQGWQPFGNPYVSTKSNEFQICQAMVSDGVKRRPYRRGGRANYDEEEDLAK